MYSSWGERGKEGGRERPNTEGRREGGRAGAGKEGGREGGRERGVRDVGMKEEEYHHLPFLLPSFLPYLVVSTLVPLSEEEHVSFAVEVLGGKYLRGREGGREDRWMVGGRE